jgi:hypothetical protein
VDQTSGLEPAPRMSSVNPDPAPVRVPTSLDKGGRPVRGDDGLRKRTPRRDTRCAGHDHPSRGCGIKERVGDTAGEQMPPTLTKPTRRIVVATAAKPSLEPDHRDLVVPAHAVEQVDELARVPQQQVAVLASVLREPPHRRLVVRTGSFSRIRSRSRSASARRPGEAPPRQQAQCARPRS